MASESEELPLFPVAPRTLRTLVENRKEKDLFEEDLASLGGLDGLERSLQTHRQRGITDLASIENREEHFGKNFIESKPPASYLQLLWDAMQDTTLIMLIIAAIVSLILGLTVEDPDTGWIEGCAILVSVAVVANVTAGNDWLKERQFQKLNNAVENEDINVVRGGEQTKVPAQELVVGDVVVIQHGDKIYADGFLANAESLAVDESSQTGESELVKKTVDGAPIMLSGTTVREGSGVMIVIAVGKHSQAGVISSLILKSKGLAVDDADEADAAAPAAVAAAAAAASSAEQVQVVVEGGPASEAAAKSAAAGAVAAGKAAAADDDEAEAGEHDGRSVLASKLDVMAVNIGKAGAVVAVVCVVVMIVVWCCAEFAETFCDDSCEWESDTHPGELLGFFITGITILVVAIPEGLPLAVTLSLAFTGYRMLQEKNLVRHLYACETMGSATTICTDKTGTLTTNVMTLNAVVLGGKVFDPPVISGPVANAHFLLWNFALNAAVNSHKNTRLKQQPDGTDQMLGNPTEGAIIGFTKSLGPNYEYSALRENPAFSYANPIREFPFSSATKWSGMVIGPEGTSITPPVFGGDSSAAGAGAGAGGAGAGGAASAGAGGAAGGESSGYRLFAKGAPERVLKLCTHVWWLNESTGVTERLELTDERREALSDAQGKFALQGLRTLALTYKDLSTEEASDLEGLEASVNEGSTLLGIVGIQDPVRPEVPNAIRTCNRAGVNVIMCTGDHITTAKSIAAECGILKRDDPVYKAMTGEEFRKRVLNPDETLNQAEFDKIWPTLRVLARCSPTDKFNLVSGLQNSNLFLTMRKDPSRLGAPIYPDRQVVAVTGDGTNDAPALSRADVGFAMGINGTAVARLACDIVLLDDNFGSIVVACKWGRNVYDSVAKFLQFQLTVNISAITIASVGAIILQESPLTAVQLLWVNLIMDSFASLALATEPPTDILLQRPPYGRNRSIIARQMWFNMLGHAFYQVIVILIIVFEGENLFDIDNGRKLGHDADPTQHYTIVFNTFVLMQIFNEINARKLYGEWNVFGGIHRNPLYIIIVVFTLAAQIIIVEFGGRAFSAEPLDGDQWLWCLILGFIALPWQFVINAIARATPQEWLAAVEYEASEGEGDVEAATPIARATSAHSMAEHEDAGPWGIASALAAFVRSRNRTRKAVTDQVVDSFGLTAEAEAARTRRTSIVASKHEEFVRRHSRMARTGTAPPQMEGGFFATQAQLRDAAQALPPAASKAARTGVSESKL